MTETILEHPTPGVALLRISRPEARNALSQSVRDEMAAEIEALATDSQIRCIVITGDEKAFAAGADLKELAMRGVFDDGFARSRILWRALEACGKPLIAAVHGFALGGGCELALHCDIVVAGEGARFGQTEVKVGIMPDAGGGQRFLRAAGKVKTLRRVLTGDIFSAQQAYEAGWISEVVPDAEVLPHALALAGKIAALAPLSVAAIKENVSIGAEAGLTAALQFEHKGVQLLFAALDRSEGIAAFFESAASRPRVSRSWRSRSPRRRKSTTCCARRRASAWVRSSFSTSPASTCRAR
jgi:enoyl-CoA hydratase/carnithine racemase